MVEGKGAKAGNVPFGEGAVNLAAVIDELRRSQFAGHVMGESGGTNLTVRDFMAGALRLTFECLMTCLLLQIVFRLGCFNLDGEMTRRDLIIGAWHSPRPRSPGFWAPPTESPFPPRIGKGRA
jgi:hypothetical protein